MVDQTKKDLAVGIIDFLTSSIRDGTVSSDDKDSVEVAIECLSDVFGVSLADKQKIYGNDSLLSLYTNAKKEKTSAAGPEASTKVVSEEDKKKAEDLKVQGNRQMAQKNFTEAVALYTQAIELDPKNAVYLSNRSAAYSSLRESQKAADDAKKAIEIDSTYAKAYSRLGLALYSLGDAQGALEAYKNGLEAEGENKSDGMKRGYETAKKRVEEELGSTEESSSTTTRAADNASAADSLYGNNNGPGGLPDLSSLLGGAGGGAGGMPDFSSILSNPQFSQMAQSIMSNPNLGEMMNNPSVQQMMSGMRNGQMPSFSDLMSNPAVQNLARSMGMDQNGNNANNDNEHSN